MILLNESHPQKPETPELTEWFDGATCVPGQVGVYEVELADRPAFQHWCGDFWGAVSTSTEKAFSYREDESTFQSLRWRGLKNNPNGSNK